jgi:predicted RND superfamily exporter protein
MSGVAVPADVEERLNLNAMESQSDALSFVGRDQVSERSCFSRHLDSKILPAAIVAIFVLILLPGGVFGAIHLFNKLVFADFKPREDTLIGQSHNCVNEWGWQTVNQNPLSIVVQSKPRGQSLIDGLNVLPMLALTEQLIGLQQQYDFLALSVSSYFIPGYMNTSYVGGINNDSVLFSVWWDTMDAKPYVGYIQDFLDNTIYSQLGMYTMTVTGIPPLESAMKHTVLKNMGMIDAICIPVGLCIFAVAVRTSPFTMLVPLLTLILSLAGGLGLSAPLHPTLTITAFAPEMMMSVVIALSMDFSLFLLSRIREQKENDARNDISRAHGAMVWLCLKRVSHNILISGFAVTLAFSGLLFINDDFVRGCAAVSAIGALYTTFASVTFMPSLVVLLYPILFEWQIPCKKNRLLSAAVVEDYKTQTPPLTDAVGEGHETNDSGRWFTIVRFATKHPLLVLMPVCGVVGVFLFVLITGFSYDSSTLSIVPYDISYFPLFTDLTQLFGPIGMAPFYIIVASACSELGDSQSVMSAAHFPMLDVVVDGLLASPQTFGVTLRDIVSPNVYNGRRVSFAESIALMANDSVYVEMIQTIVGTANLYNPPFVAINLLPPKAQDSYGPPQKGYLNALNNFVNSLTQNASNANATSGLFVGFYGPQAGLWSTMVDVMGQFKTQVVVTLALLTVVICILFKSLLMAVRMLVTMFTTLCFSFGMVTSIVHYHWFDSTWRPMAHVDAYFWIIPVLTFSIVCVISLDYDVFLMTRVLELRRHVGEASGGALLPDSQRCHSEVDCVIYAVGRTGETISWAATIMFIAFGALGFANTVMMATYGMTIAFAVVFDAFVVRPMVVPAMVSLLSSAGLSWLLWWPRRLPEFHRKLEKTQSV